MTNLTNTFTRDIDNIRFTMTLPDDDRAILRAAITLQLDASAYLLNAATRDLNTDNPYNIDAAMPMTQFDYSADHDDYNPAAAHILATITDALCAHPYSTARDMMIDLFNTSDDFLIDLDTASLNFPLIDIDDETLDN